MIDNFHPAVRQWFNRQFPHGPTPPQQQAWKRIADGHNTLLAAPTGSGKTLASLLIAIDQLYRQHASSDLGSSHSSQPSGDHNKDTSANSQSSNTGKADPPEQVQVVYVSPLKALATDISQNLERPLQEIAECARELGLEPPKLSVFVRSGDTPQTERLAMVRRPPTFVITTPESFYLLLTAEKSREMLRTTKLVIVDEIHAVARDKRGSHLALSLERLEHICHQPPQRVGLSATQRPLDKIASLLVGANRPCEIIDAGHQRNLDLALHLPDTELEAVPSHEQTREVLTHIAELTRQHHTTLVFVNTRRMAERMAHQLAEILEDDQVAAHHGSLSKERRQLVESRLRSGNLRVLVATASLELGIDIGPVELVCQLGSPRSIAVFLQRVGRSNHSRYGTPKGRLFPLTRDELVECAALLRAVKQGKLDAVEPPVAPRDILAQQIVAECAAEAWQADELFQLVRQAAPYNTLSSDEFNQAVEFASQGVLCGHGPKGAYIRWNKLNGELSARRGARLAAITSGGAIPDVADYRVVLDPDDTFIGTVHEDWAVESMAGDIFLLGTHSWRIRRVENGIVRVVDAEGAPPTLPFWLGEAPGRTAELSQEVGQLLEEIEAHFQHSPANLAQAQQMLETECGISSDAASFLLSYLSTSRSLLQTLPSHQRIVVERFFDETGGMQLVVHNPRGSRINRGLGLALRKRFCRTFDFELQAAANDNAIVLSLGPQHSFPLEDIARYVTSDTVEDILEQAVLPTPIFTARWRWNLNRALTVLRFKRGKRNPPQIQRMEADDVMAAVFPSLAACQDNALGPTIEIPDHLLVRQTVDDALREALDISRLTALLRDIENNSVEMCFVDTTEPSPLSHEVLNGKPFTYLDDAPLEERRTQAVVMRRGLDPSLIANLDAGAIERVRAEVKPDPRDANELHDVLMWHVALAEREEWNLWFEELAGQKRAVALELDNGTDDEANEAKDKTVLWCPAELTPEVMALWPQARDAGVGQDEPNPASFDSTDTPAGPATTATTDPAESPDSHESPDPADTAIRLVRGHLDSAGPITIKELEQTSRLQPAQIKSALAQLEAQGYALQGHWEAKTTATEVVAAQWCSRRLLQRIYHYSKKERRRKVELATAQDFMRFLLRWQHVAPECQVRGLAGLSKIIAQLQCWEMPAVAWEEEVLRRRVKGYSPDMLDQLCLSGEIAWGRLSISARAESQDKANSVFGPSKTTPITLLLRGDLGWLLESVRSTTAPLWPTSGATAEILEILQTKGARFLAELATDTHRLPEDLENGLRDGIARGLLTSDSFSSLRLLLKNSYARHTRGRRSNYPRYPSNRLRSAVGARSAMSGYAPGSVNAKPVGVSPVAPGTDSIGRVASRPANSSPRLAQTSGRPWSFLRSAGSIQTDQHYWGSQGRWVLLTPTQPDSSNPNQPEQLYTQDADELAEIFAEQLLRRWGIVFRDLFVLENCSIPWREILWAFRRLEARGVIQGGRFVSGFTGEQFALPAATDELRFVKKRPRTGEKVTVNATDPLNLTGILTGTERIPAIHTRQVVYTDGAPSL